VTIALILGYILQPDSGPHPQITVFPYVGVTLLPLLLWVALTLWSFRSSLPWLLKPFLFVLCAALVLVGVLHCLMTVGYGNMNNEAWSDSWMIDVVAPPEFFSEFLMLEDFAVAKNSSEWLASVSSPQLPRNLPDCGPRVFVRFMTHRASPKTPAARILPFDNIFFYGAWIMTHAKDRPGVKLWTDFVTGNLSPMNKLLPLLWVDRHVNLVTFENSLDFEKKEWTIRSPPNSVYKEPTTITAQATGEKFDDRSFMMDQYSCMVESTWLNHVTGQRWCFLKKMEAAVVHKLKGTISSPNLRKPLSFPSGSPEDCSAPYVVGVLAEDLHWTRVNYQC
jgi:hypothetical protein